MIRAARYEILRNVEANGRLSLPLAEKPRRVATLLDEAAFLANDGLLEHNRTVFLEDQHHDWQWANGRFTYYTRVAARADVLVVYEEAPASRLTRSTGPTPAAAPVPLPDPTMPTITAPQVPSGPADAPPVPSSGANDTDRAGASVATLLPLLDQMDFTSGLCSAFAIAAHRLLPGSRLQVLISEDPRHLKTHDWPVDMPMTVHAFVALPDGRVLDAEGARPLAELAASFGVRKTYRQRVETLTPDTLAVELPYHEEWVLDALATMRRHGWGPGVELPAGTGELTRRWKATRKEEDARGPRPMPELAQAQAIELALVASEPTVPAPVRPVVAPGR